MGPQPCQSTTRKQRRTCCPQFTVGSFTRSGGPDTGRFMSVSIEVTDVDKGFDDVMEALTDVQADHVVVGFTSKTESEILDRAVGNEFGRKVKVGKKYFEVPARPFVRGTVDKDIKDITDMGEFYGKQVLNGKMGKKEALEAWGEFLRDRIKNNVVNETLGLEPNAESTIERKGSEKPLIDENHMINQMNIEVRR